MRRIAYHIGTIGVLFINLICVTPSFAWDTETHLAVALSAGYHGWYNAAGADMAKIKAGDIEANNHYVGNPRYGVISPQMVLAQVEKYDQVDRNGHLYGAILASLRNYVSEKKNGKYGEFHLAFCAHYVGDLSQPLHNIPFNDFNQTYHRMCDHIVEAEVLDNLHKIRIYPITIHSEQDLATEVARIANLSKDLGYKLEAENRPLTKAEAYTQLSHSASLFRAILDYLHTVSPN